MAIGRLKWLATGSDASPHLIRISNCALEDGGGDVCHRAHFGHEFREDALHPLRETRLVFNVRHRQRSAACGPKPHSGLPSSTSRHSPTRSPISSGTRRTRFPSWGKVLIRFQRTLIARSSGSVPDFAAAEANANSVIMS